MIGGKAQRSIEERHTLLRPGEGRLGRGHAGRRVDPAQDGEVRGAGRHSLEVAEGRKQPRRQFAAGKAEAQRLLRDAAAVLDDAGGLRLREETAGKIEETAGIGHSAFGFLIGQPASVTSWMGSMSSISCMSVNF